jgi:hypothetical protein
MLKLSIGLQSIFIHGLPMQPLVPVFPLSLLLEPECFKLILKAGGPLLLSPHNPLELFVLPTQLLIQRFELSPCFFVLFGETFAFGLVFI